MAAQKLDVDFDQELARWNWRAERIGWCVWIAVLCGALLGFLGDGPFTGARATSPGQALSLDYQRFVHRHDAQELKFTVRPTETSAPTVALTLPATFLDAVQIDRIVPIPLGNSASPEEGTFVFERPSSKAATQIVFHVQYDAFGKIEGSARVPGDEPVRFVQTVYP
jgi:hypothetical protein